MKNLKLFLILIVPILLMSSKCIDKNKNDADNFQILKGRLMVDCNTPYASSLVQLRSTQYGINKGVSFCEDVNGNTEFYTDENGYFEINYRKIGPEGFLYAPYEVMKSIPLGEKSLDMGEVNLGGKVNFVIKLQVNNPYSANDTLFCYDWGYPNNGAEHWVKKIPGPFADGIIDSIINLGYSKYPLNYTLQPKLSTRYNVGSNSSIDVSVETPFCDGEFSELIYVID